MKRKRASDQNTKFIYMDSQTLLFQIVKTSKNLNFDKNPKTFGANISNEVIDKYHLEKL